MPASFMTTSPFSPLPWSLECRKDWPVWQQPQPPSLHTYHLAQQSVLSLVHPSSVAVHAGPELLCTAQTQIQLESLIPSLLSGKGVVLSYSSDCFWIIIQICIFKII